MPGPRCSEGNRLWLHRSGIVLQVRLNSRSGAALGRVPRACAVLVCAWLVLVGLLVLCGEGVKHSGVVNSADRRVTSFVVAHRTPLLNDVMKVVTWAGSWVAVAVVAVVIGASPVETALAVACTGRRAGIVGR